ncbi:hypothetical protein GCM10028809_57300 [Spirosoma gilvum]
MSNPDAGWAILSSAETRIRRKIEEMGKPLKEWDIQINYGIKTGFNDAFIVDGATKDELIRLDPKSAEIIRPILRGRDIKAYQAEFSDKWLIFTRRGIDIDQYPAIRFHLQQFYKELLPKQNGAITGRKPGAYKWFEIQDNIAYFEDLDKPKIIYPEITKFLPFVYDESKYYLNNKTFFIVGERLKYLVAFLNSSLFKAIFKGYFPDLGEDRRELRKIFFEQINIQKPTVNTEQEISSLVDEILVKKQKCLNTITLESELDSQIYNMYNLSESEIVFIKSSGFI